MDLNEYQNDAEKTANYGEAIEKSAVSRGITYPRDLSRFLGMSYVVEGMVGEAGEIANKVKKAPAAQLLNRAP